MWMHPNASTKERQEAQRMQAANTLKIKLSLMYFMLAIILSIGFFIPTTAHAAIDLEQGFGSKLPLIPKDAGIGYLMNSRSGSGEIADSMLWAELNGTREDGETRELSYLYYAGSLHRTGYILYLVEENPDTGAVSMVNQRTLIGGGEDSSLGIILFKDESLSYGVTETVYETHFGYINNITKFRLDDLVLPVRPGSGTNNWAGNTEAFNAYLTKEVPGTNNDELIANWQLIFHNAIRDHLGETAAYSAIDYLIKHDNVTLVFEPISSQALYKGDKWTKSNIDNNGYQYDDTVGGYVFNQDLFSPDGDYCFPVGADKPLLKEIGGELRVRKVLTTAFNAAKYNAEQTRSEWTPAEEWVYEALPYSATLDTTQLGIKGITSGSHVLTLAEASDKKKGYGIVMLNRLFPYINTYDIDTKPTVPEKSENPSREKGTLGDVTIVKVYGETILDEQTGTKTVNHIAKFERKNSSRYINLYDEESITGYKLVYAIQHDGYFSQIYAHNFLTKLSKAGQYEYLGTGKAGSNGKMRDGNKYLYVLYMKTKSTPTPTTAEYDFEIPESYITKQIWFNQANATTNTNTALKLIDHNFEWKSDAHNPTTCPGHKVLNCGKEIHPHKPWQSIYDPGCYEEIKYTVYTCNNERETKCGKEHTHSDANCKKVIYKCTICRTQGDTKEAAASYLFHKNCTGEIYKTYGEYKSQEYKCVQCSKIYDTKPSSCSNCSGGTILAVCATPPHNCSEHTKEKTKISTYTILSSKDLVYIHLIGVYFFAHF